MQSESFKQSRKRKCNRTTQCRQEAQTKNRISRKRMYSSSAIHKCKVVVFSRQCKLGLYLQGTFISGKWLKPAGGRLGPRLTFYVRRRQAAVSNLTPLVYGGAQPRRCHELQNILKNVSKTGRTKEKKGKGQKDPKALMARAPSVFFVAFFVQTPSG